MSVLEQFDSDALIAELERRGVLDPDHIVDIRDDNFALQHPARCRPDMFGCDVHLALSALEGRPMPIGRYRVDLADDVLTNWRGVTS